MQYEIISESHSHRIIALSDTEVGKIPPINRIVFVNVATGEEEPMLSFKMDIDLEIKRLVYANAINDLMVRFIRKDKFENNIDMLVMERLYPIEYKSISKIKRISVFEKFEKQISELHFHGFLHGDIEHPMRAEPEILFNNIILTTDGLRLIDTGFSLIKEEEQNKDKYVHLLRREMLEILDFKEFFLS
jgi:tRNA A-37 threonylcarbamoyl transferase component Bud32